MTRLPDNKRHLFPAEKRYLILAAHGLSAKATAARCGVTVNTVNAMVARAKAALGAKSLAHAIALAVMTGQITPQDLRDV